MAFYLQLLNRAFNQAHVNGKFSAPELQSILTQLGFDASLSSSVQGKVWTTIVFTPSVYRSDDSLALECCIVCGFFFLFFVQLTAVVFSLLRRASGHCSACILQERKVANISIRGQNTLAVGLTKAASRNILPLSAASIASLQCVSSQVC